MGLALLSMRSCHPHQHSDTSESLLSHRGFCFAGSEDSCVRCWDLSESNLGVAPQSPLEPVQETLQMKGSHSSWVVGLAISDDLLLSAGLALRHRPPAFVFSLTPRRSMVSHGGLVYVGGCTGSVSGWSPRVLRSQCLNQGPSEAPSTAGHQPPAADTEAPAPLDAGPLSLWMVGTDWICGLHAVGSSYLVACSHDHHVRALDLHRVSHPHNTRTAWPFGRLASERLSPFAPAVRWDVQHRGSALSSALVGTKVFAGDDDARVSVYTWRELPWSSGQHSRCDGHTKRAVEAFLWAFYAGLPVAHPTEMQLLT
eukprot:gene3243-3757_t